MVREVNTALAVSVAESAAVKRHLRFNGDTGYGRIGLGDRVRTFISHDQPSQLCRKFSIGAGRNNRVTLLDCKNCSCPEIIRKIIGIKCASFAEHLVDGDLILVLGIRIRKRTRYRLTRFHLDSYFLGRWGGCHGVAGDFRSGLFYLIDTDRQIEERIVACEDVGIGHRANLIICRIVYVKNDSSLLIFRQVVNAQVTRTDGFCDLQRTVRRIFVVYFCGFGFVCIRKLRSHSAITGYGKHTARNRRRAKILGYRIGSQRNITDNVLTVSIHIRIVKCSRGGLIRVCNSKFCTGRNSRAGSCLLDFQICGLLYISVFKRSGSRSFFRDRCRGRGMLLRLIRGNTVNLVGPGITVDEVHLFDRIGSDIKIRQRQFTFGKVRIRDSFAVSIRAGNDEFNVFLFAIRDGMSIIPVRETDNLVQFKVALVIIIIV